MPMNHSFYGADRTTHLKIVVLSAFAATAVVGVSTAAHVHADSVASAPIVVSKDRMPTMATNQRGGPA